MKTHYGNSAKAVIGAVILFVGILSASAVSLIPTSLNTNQQADAPASWFNVGLVVNGNGTATYTVANLVAAGNATKISTIYIGTTAGFSSYFQTNVGSASGAGTNFSIDWSPGGAGFLPWALVAEGDPANGNNNSTINPGETLSLTFSLVNPLTTEQQLIAGFNSAPQGLGIAFHVQSIGNGDSEKYEAKPSSTPNPGGGGRVPDGGTTIACLGMALLGLGSMRKLIASKA